ncbi:hypothetical protein V512_012735 [Mesotoga sp. Brook.08.105.5.1]|nr:hypothetical protein V512_012735 [Mesotoga sp. Brook.08.105.5.1]RAO95956.1 hypothetical protein M388_05515 [Mesotoga sp. Brook.08.YT.4.2.5.4.]
MLFPIPTATPDPGLLLFLTMQDLLSLLALNTLEYGFSRSKALGWSLSFLFI